MCIAILNKKQSVLNDEILTNCFINNPDGAGFAFIDQNKELKIIKGIFQLNVFLETYKTIKKTAISDVLIHCRIGTSGNKDHNNTHPHIINNDLVLIHNGILNIKVPENSTKSDTILFIEQYLKNLTISQIQDKSYRRLLADFIGLNNKFIIMDRYGQSYIINNEQGTTDTSGNWFSNTSYQFTGYYPYIGNTIYKPSKKLKKRIKNTIENLNYYYFAELGKYPLVDIKTGDFYSETMFDKYDITNKEDYTNIYYLDDIDDELYNLYMDYYYNVIEDNYYSEVI